jgi:hypothetical protein
LHRLLAPRQLRTFAHLDLRVVTAPFDRDQAERARIKFIETPMLIDAIGGEHAGPAAAAPRQPASAESTSPSSAKAGCPVRRSLSIPHNCSGILDHPLSRVMTVILVTAGHAGGFARCSREVSVIPINPAATLLAKRDARIDIAIDASARGGGHAFGIGPVGAIARNAPTTALDAIRIIERGRRTGAGYRGGTGRH